MVDGAEYLSIRFFCTDAGNQPVREWLKELPKEEKRRIGEDIKTVQYGWPLGMPLVIPMGDGLYEIRTNLDNKIARVLICFSDNQIILLHGFIKKSKKTPDNDLKLAKRRKDKIN
ncbi:MAG: type II toxin-antitoxin system RelE/ParE family toxin [Desulfuromonadales bacterium]